MDSPQGTEVAEPEIDAQEQGFLDAAALVDRGEDIPADLIGEVKPDETPADETQPPVEEKPATAKKARKRDAQGRFLKDDGSVDENQVETPAETAQPEPAGKPPSEFEQKKAEKARKEKERQDRSWEALNREKDEIRQYRSQLEQWQQQSQQMFQQQQLQNQRPAGQQYTSRDLFEAAREFDRRAADELAKLQAGDPEADVKKVLDNRRLVQQAWQQGVKIKESERQQAEQSNLYQWNGAYQAHQEQEVTKDKELLNAESPISKELQSIFGEEGLGEVFYWLRDTQGRPNGFAKAIELAKLRLAAAEVKSLRPKLAEYETKIKELTGATELGAGGPTKQAPPKSFANMSDDEAEAAVMREAERFDSANT